MRGWVGVICSGIGWRLNFQDYVAYLCFGVIAG